MKLQYLSDIHLEFWRDPDSFFKEYDAADAQTVVLAGDICGGLSIAKVMRHFVHAAPEVDFVYVEGNHEYYGNSPAQVAEVVDRMVEKYPRVHALRSGRELVLHGRRFVGATMWFARGFPDHLRGGLSDFRYIKGFEPWIYEQNSEWVEWYRANGREGDVVVTHHLPAQGSIAPQYAGDPFNAFFLCDSEADIVKNRPALWIHGHTHNACDYMVGATRVVANPAGYPQEMSAYWKPRMIEI